MKDKCPTVTASAWMSGNNQPVVFIPRAYCIDRSAFNCGANAKFDMPIVAELCTTLRARGPNAVAVIREEE